MKSLIILLLILLTSSSAYAIYKESDTYKFANDLKLALKAEHDLESLDAEEQIAALGPLYFLNGVHKTMRASAYTLSGRYKANDETGVFSNKSDEEMYQLCHEILYGFNFPKSYRLAIGMKIVSKYLEENPERLSGLLTFTIFEAFENAYQTKN